MSSHFDARAMRTRFGMEKLCKKTSTRRRGGKSKTKKKRKTKKRKLKKEKKEHLNTNNYIKV